MPIEPLFAPVARSEDPVVILFKVPRHGLIVLLSLRLAVLRGFLMSVKLTSSLQLQLAVPGFKELF